ncbi:potassium channel family protein [Thermosynechococcaceae cyanobacterium BACA0444]|uniref:Potassium channel family protein n=1 Tax=Pseudocalidococcus azoricus BACA0444 TaxID=2918990 RepID=A0AAE4FTX8_9CYAN|nr:potassium channel family protein [Pseudocalidococcus azoricus]MDS3862126.1 potassium channel family protein [Pseudocalidococcus azoricus BACA0444]
MVDRKSSHSDPFWENQYARLFIGLISLILIPTLFSERWSSLISFSLETFVIVLILQILRARRIKFYIYLVVSLSIFALELLDYFSNYVQQNIGILIDLLTGVVHLTFSFMVIQVILKKIFTQQSVTRDSILGGVSVYLLLGFSWAFAYRMLYNLDSSSFNLTKGVDISWELGYFSFVTLTTVGYGDITPATGVAMALSILEAVIGQMYPAIIISCLISQYLSSSQAPRL